jgi:hypothetical protein
VLAILKVDAGTERRWAGAKADTQGVAVPGAWTTTVAG